jgi:hypothetical protein
MGSARQRDCVVNTVGDETLTTSKTRSVNVPRTFSGSVDRRPSSGSPGAGYDCWLHVASGPRVRRL